MYVYTALSNHNRSLYLVTYLFKHEIEFHYKLTRYVVSLHCLATIVQGTLLSLIQSTSDMLSLTLISHKLVVLYIIFTGSVKASKVVQTTKT